MFPRSAWRVGISWGSKECLSILHEAASSHIFVDTTTSQLTIQKLQWLACWHEAKQRFLRVSYRNRPSPLTLPPVPALAGRISGSFQGADIQTSKARLPFPVISSFLRAGLDEVNVRFNRTPLRSGLPSRLMTMKPSTTDVRGCPCWMDGWRSIEFSGAACDRFLPRRCCRVVRRSVWSMSLSPCQDAPSFDIFLRSPARPLHSTPGRG